MHKIIIFVLLCLIGLAIAIGQMQHNDQMVRHDFTGEYLCDGVDGSEGAYTGKVTMMHLPQHESKGYSSYQFTLTVPDYGTYQGHAVAKGNDVAIHFALPTQEGVYGGKDQDFGTGLAKFKQTDGKWSFEKFYYEPYYKGGNTGLETCTQQ